MSRPSRTIRRLAGLGVAVGLATAAAVLAPMAASAAPAASFAAADQAAIGPGVQIETPVGDGAELCTSNFVFSDGGTVYLGTAAHCTAGENASTSVDGCTEPVMGEGTKVAIVGRDGKRYAGTVAYNSWATMQKVGETDKSACELNDLALIAVAPEDVAKTNPTVPGFGGPTALNTEGVPAGEMVYSYQPNQTTASPYKQGLSAGQDDPRTHVVTTVPPGVPGDSGSGYMDSKGNAFGSLSSLMLPTASNGVADLGQALEYAASHGGPAGVSVVPGDQPFAPTGLPLTTTPSGPQLPNLPLTEMVPAPLG